MPVKLVVEEGPHAGVSRADIARRARAMLAAVALPDCELSVMLTDDGRIQELNRLYRKKNKPTDVLAFAQREGELGSQAGRILGDVVISVPTARRQAEERGRDLISELTMLLAHGLLHLLGWDHETEAKDRRMQRETARLCEASETAARAPRRPRSAVSPTKGRAVARSLRDSATRRTSRSGRP